MSRVEENEKMIVHFTKSAMETGSGTYEEMVSWHLGTMNSFLADISKSLAMIADKMASTTGAESEGHWIVSVVPGEHPFFAGRYYCSVCGDWQTYATFKHCPNCGARMSGEVEKE